MTIVENSTNMQNSSSCSKNVSDDKVLQKIKTFALGTSNMTSTYVQLLLLCKNGKLCVDDILNSQIPANNKNTLICMITDTSTFIKYMQEMYNDPLELIRGISCNIPFNDEVLGMLCKEFEVKNNNTSRFIITSLYRDFYNQSYQILLVEYVKIKDMIKFSEVIDGFNRTISNDILSKLKNIYIQDIIDE
mgnify:CR=1 FL=1